MTITIDNTKNMFFIYVYDLQGFMNSVEVIEGKPIEQQKRKMLKENQFLRWIEAKLLTLKNQQNEQYIIIVKYQGKTHRIISSSKTSIIKIVIDNFPHILTGLLKSTFSDYKGYLCLGNQLNILEYICNKIEKDGGEIIIEDCADFRKMEFPKTRTEQRLEYFYMYPFIFNNYGMLQQLKNIYLTPAELSVHLKICPRCSCDFYRIMFHKLCILVYEDNVSPLDIVIYLPLLTFREYIKRNKLTIQLFEKKTDDFLDSFINYKQDLIRPWNERFCSAMCVPDGYDPMLDCEEECTFLLG